MAVHSLEAGDFLLELRVRAFALTGKPIKNNARKGVVRDELMAELFIDRVETYYKKRRDIIWAVVDCALVLKACIKGSKWKRKTKCL